jgi:TIR domain
MSGINRAQNTFATRNFSLLERMEHKAPRKCVFLSHHKSDMAYCRRVADYIMDLDVDVYFDEDDGQLEQYRLAGNPDGVTNCIRAGIDKSDFMLCVVSTRTGQSSWVPFELGYGFGRGRTELGILTLAGVNEEDLPDYARTSKFILDDLGDLNDFLASHANEARLILESSGQRTFSESLGNAHPLYGVLNIR